MSGALPSTLVPKYLQDDDLSQECRELISSLPTENGWIANQLHKYQGYWYSTRHQQGVLAFQKHFQALDTDILLTTTPKSGTTWLKAITFAILNRYKCSADTQKHPLLSISPHDLVPFLEFHLFEERNHVPNFLSSLPSPRLLSTHVGYEPMPKSVKDSGCKLIYLCRNPKDTFVSMWHFASQPRAESRRSLSMDEAFVKFSTGVSAYGPFWDHVLGYWKASLEHPEKILFLKYEDIKENPKDMLKSIAEFMGCPFSKQEEEPDGTVDKIFNLCSFRNLSNMEVNKVGKLTNGIENKTYFRQGQVGDWKNHLTHEMIEKLNSINEKKLGAHGLKL